MTLPTLLKMMLLKLYECRSLVRAGSTMPDGPSRSAVSCTVIGQGRWPGPRSRVTLYWGSPASGQRGRCRRLPDGSDGLRRDGEGVAELDNSSASLAGESDTDITASARTRGLAIWRNWEGPKPESRCHGAGRVRFASSPKGTAATSCEKRGVKPHRTKIWPYDHAVGLG
jgi:hypothetical protein